MQMYKNDGKKIPDFVGSVYYNRGVLNGSILVEGIRLAIVHFGLPVTGEKVKMGYERIKDYTLGGFLPPFTVTPQDHEGGGWVQLYQTKGGKLVKHTDWFMGYRDVVLDEIKKAAMKK